MRQLFFIFFVMLPACVSDTGLDRAEAFRSSIQRYPAPADSPLYETVEVGKIYGGREGSYVTTAGSIDTRNLFATKKMDDYLSAALEGRDMLAVDGATYRIDVDIKKSRTQALVFNKATVTSEVSYQLIKNDNDELVYTTSVEAVGEASIKDSFIQPTKIGLAIGYALGESTTIAVDRFVEYFHPEEGLNRIPYPESPADSTQAEEPDVEEATDIAPAP